MDDLNPDLLSGHGGRNLPGLMVAFAFLHGLEGVADWLALAAGCAVQFVIFAVAGMPVAAASRVIFPAGSRRGQQDAALDVPRRYRVECGRRDSNP